MYTIPLDIQNSSIEGRGYFANQDVPVGTIVYFYSESDIRYTPDEFAKLDQDAKKRIAEFAVEDEFGNWVETSTGAFTNHSCDPNIMPLFVGGQYCDIAVRDIKKGEEVTIDYSLFYSSQKWSMDCHCGSAICRHTVGFGIDIGTDYERLWSDNLNNALQNMTQVPQPLFSLTDKYAITLAEKINKNPSPTIGKYVKYSLILNNT